MGSFSVPCAVTGVGIAEYVDVVVLAVVPNGRGYLLAAPPVRGYYDDYGRARIDPKDAAVMLLGKTLREWWDQVGLVTADNETYWSGDHIHTTNHVRRDEHMRQVGGKNVTVFFVLKAIWDCKDTFEYDPFGLPSTTLPQLLQSDDFATYIEDEIASVRNLADVKASGDRDAWVDAMSDLLLSMKPHPFHLAMNSIAFPYKSTTELMAYYVRCWREEDSSALVERSPLYEQVTTNYKSYLKTNPSDEDLRREVRDVFTLLFEALFMAIYMTAGGVYLGSRPRVPQWAPDGWDAQRKFHADTLAVLDAMIATRDRED